MSPSRIIQMLYGVLLVLCWPGCSMEPSPPFRIGMNVWPGYESFFLARSLGYFEGTPVQLVEYRATPEALRAFHNRALEAIAVTGDEFLRLSEAAPDVRAILVMDFSKGADALVARPGIKTLSDLKGKKIGVEPNAVGTYLFHRACELGNVSPDQLTIVPVSNTGHVEAFQQGGVDAVVTFEPHLSNLTKAGGVVLFDTSMIPGEIVDLLAVREETIAARPQLLQEVVQTWFRGVDYMNTDKADAAQRVAPRGHVSAQEFQTSLRGLELPSLEANKRMLGGPKELAKRLTKLNRIMLQHKLISRELDPSPMLDDTFVKGVK